MTWFIYSLIFESFSGLILSFPEVSVLASAKSSPDNTILGPLLMLFPHPEDSSTTKILKLSFCFLREIHTPLPPTHFPTSQGETTFCLLPVTIGRYFLVLPFLILQSFKGSRLCSFMSCFLFGSDQKSFNLCLCM